MDAELPDLEPLAELEDLVTLNEFSRLQVPDLEWLVKNMAGGDLYDASPELDLTAGLDLAEFAACPHPGNTGQVTDQGQSTSYDGSAVAQSARQPSMTALPACTVYPGPYQFHLDFGKQPKETKSAAWTYSHSLNKLYAQKDAMCPVRFRADSTMGGSLYIRALPIFMRHEYVQEIVRRCPNHVQAPENANVPHKEHFVWCEHQSAQYVTGGSAASLGRLSVLVPFEQPPAGTPWVTYLYSFKCLNSCVGGPNRREMTMIFTLENQSGEILGRQSFDLRICACPGRDRKTDEGKQESSSAAPAAPAALTTTSIANSVTPQQAASGSPSASTGAYFPPPPQQVVTSSPSAASRRGHSLEGNEATVAKRPRASEDDIVYCVFVKGRSNYELLCQVRDSLELADRVRPAEKQQYLQLRQYSDGLVTAGAGDSVVSAACGGTSFTFSCDNAVKNEVVDSTQPGSSGGGTDMTDSADDVTSTSSVEPSAMTVLAWLTWIGLPGYHERFQSLGYSLMKDLIRNVRTLDLASLGIPLQDRGTLWKHLLLYRLRTSGRRILVMRSPGHDAGTSATVTLMSAPASQSPDNGSQPVVVRLTNCTVKAEAPEGHDNATP